MMTLRTQTVAVLLAVAVIVGCSAGTEPELQARGQEENQSSGTVTAITDSPTTSDELSRAPMDDFSWVVDGELAAMPLPGRHRDLADDAGFLRQEGIGTLVSLTETPPDAKVLASSGITQVHIPVSDFTAPTLEQMIEFVDAVRASADRGEPVGVHCTAGLGRSGTMAAAYLVAQGASATEAIATVRRLRPGSVETEAQEEAVDRYQNYLRESR